MNTFRASLNFDAFIVFSSAHSRAMLDQNSTFKRSSPPGHTELLTEAGAETSLDRFCESYDKAFVDTKNSLFKVVSIQVSGPLE
ncbi:MAG TPA: hypothetical protein PKA88_27805 [Polyangiaceae bacterium]|mgnify:CR=1 FL=1|nr:hypothetical protein [Polyangiaceae bacterium]